MKNNKINIDNYEIFIVDYFDGTLSKEQQLMLFAFLDAHPELKEDFEFFSEVVQEPLLPEKIAFPNPEKLKKTPIFPCHNIAENNYQEYFIAYFENDLDETGQKKLMDFLQRNKFLQPEFESFRKLKLIPDDNISFTKKAALKHHAFHFRYQYIFYSVAAVAAVFLMIFLMNFEQKPAPVPLENIAKIEENNLSDHPIISTNSVDSVEAVASDKVTPIEIQNKPKAEPKVPVLPIEEIAHSSKTVQCEQDEEIAMTSRTQDEIFAPDHENAKILQADVVVITTFSDDTTASSGMPQGEKRHLWKVLSWSVKQYNKVSSDPVVIMKVENPVTEEVSYYFRHE